MNPFMGPLHMTCASSRTGPKIIRILTSVQGSNTKCPKWTQQEWNGLGSYTASRLLHSVGYKAISKEEETQTLPLHGGVQRQIVQEHMGWEMMQSLENTSATYSSFY